MQHGFNRGEHVLLLDERHLEIELIELTGRAVSARILVSKAGCDLKVAVKARSHEQLLELLGRLGQRVERAGMNSAGHQIIPCSLGRAGRQDRGLNLGEPLVHHALADAADDVRAQQDVAVHARTAQVEKAVAQANILSILVLAMYRHGQAFGCGLDFESLDLDFHLAGGQLGIDCIIAARHHRAGHSHDAFRTQGCGGRKQHMAGLDNALSDAVMITQIDE